MQICVNQRSSFFLLQFLCDVVKYTKSVTDTLQRDMNAAARVVSDTRKFDHGLTQILHDDLHWLDVADRVTYKVTNSVSSCTDVGMARLRSTSWTVAHRSLMLSAGSVSGQPHSN